MNQQDICSGSVHPTCRIFGHRSSSVPVEGGARISFVFMSGLSMIMIDSLICLVIYPDLANDMINRMVRYSNKLKNLVV